MTNRYKFLSATAVALALPLTPVWAQSAPTETPADAAAEELAEVSEESAEQEIVITGRFQESGAKSAMKMNVSVLETPFAVSSYSDDFVKSLETSNVQDLYNYMTGVKKAGNSAADLQMRGFRTGGDDRNAIMVDGLPGLTAKFASPPTIGVERIELVKGPMSVLYGAMQPGGFINMITKKPRREASTTLEFRGQTYASSIAEPFDTNSYALAADSTGPLVGNLRYRIVGERAVRHLFRDFSGDKSTYLMPSLTWDIGSQTRLTGQIEYRKINQRFDTGLIALNNDVSLLAPITTRYNEPENFRREKGLAESFYLSHSFGGGWDWNTGFRNVDYASEQQDYSPTNIVQKSGGRWVVVRRARELHTDRTYRYFDSNVNGAFSTGPIKHKLLVGVNGGKDSYDEDRVRFVNSSTSNAAGVCPNTYCFDIGLFDPVHGLVPSISSLPATNPTLRNQEALRTHRLAETTNWAVYASDLISLTDWLKLALSGRTFEENQTITEQRLPGVPVQKKVAKKTLLPSAGVLIQPNSRLTFYGSYSESFVPADPGAQDITGRNPFPPVSSDQVEFGIKTDKLVPGLTATASVFRINQKDILTSFNCPTGSTIDGVLVTAAGNCSEPVGKVRSDGIEIEANAQIIKGLQVLAGYAYTDARVTKDRNPLLVGSRLGNVPKHSFNLWSRYDLTDHLGFGLGVIYTGQREGKLVPLADPGRLSLPAYTVVDFGIYYTLDHIAVNLKVGNVFDKRYIESSGSGSLGHTQIASGAPRNLILSTRFTF